MPQTHHTRVLIVGAGPAGYTAAIYAARASLQPTLVAGLQPGGQLMITTDVENYPGFAEVIQGPWLMEQMLEQARHVGTIMVDDLVIEADFSARPFRCRTDGGDTYLADSVIIAPAPRPAGSAWNRSSGCRAAASPPAPPATGSSTAASRSR